MLRMIWFAIFFAMFATTMAVAGEAERPVDLLALAKLEHEKMRQEWQDRQDYPGFFEEMFEADAQTEKEEQLDWLSHAYEILADSEDAGEQLFRAWMSKKNPDAAEHPLQRAFELAPENPFILSSIAYFCLRDDFPFCLAVAERLTNLPHTSANGLILAATLNFRAGHLDAQELYQLATQRRFSNDTGHQIDIIWPLVQSLGSATTEYDQVISTLGISMAIPSGNELMGICAPRVSAPLFQIDAIICRQLGRNLVNQGPGLMDRNRGVILLDWLAESTEDPDAIKEALQANQSRIDLETRMLGLSSLDGGRFERDVMATEAHLMNIVHYGEVNTYRALIAQVERGEIN